jgi:hypothetical protein
MEHQGTVAPRHCRRFVDEVDGQMPDPVVVGVDVVDQEFDDRGVIVRGAGRARVLV